MLRQRIVTALLLGALLVWLLFFQGLLAWQGFLLLAGGLAADEWAGLAGYGRALRAAFALVTVILAVALLGIPDVLASVERPLLLAGLLFWLLAAPLWLLRGWRMPAGPGFLLTGWLVILSTLLALSRLRQDGIGVLLASMALVWVSDISAYFAGRAFGRHRLAPAISPGKTWEGVAGALVGVLLFVTALTGWTMADPRLAQARMAAGLAWWPLAALLAVLGIEGDLFESWLKRCAGVKDSGWILPGHGGVLDRIDALTAALPAAALMFELAAGSAS
jgi:phosphatidate cytidylyltransferase